MRRTKFPTVENPSNSNAHTRFDSESNVKSEAVNHHYRELNHPSVAEGLPASIQFK